MKSLILAAVAALSLALPADAYPGVEYHTLKGSQFFTTPDKGVLCSTNLGMISCVLHAKPAQIRTFECAADHCGEVSIDKFKDIHEFSHITHGVVMVKPNDGAIVESNGRTCSITTHTVECSNGHGNFLAHSVKD